MGAAGDALGRLEEQQPFLGVDVEPKPSSAATTPPCAEGSTRHYSYLYTTIFFLFGLTFTISGIWYSPPEHQCVRKLNAWSPMREAITYHEVEHERSSRAKFLGLPTPQLEEAWDSLWQFGSLGIPEDSLALLNKSATERTWHHLPSEIGGGVQAYFEGFHHIHCLNLVRQYIYRHEYDYSNLHAFSNPDIDVLEHVEHCLEILRTKLMCDADTNPLLAYWNEESITVDMSAPRMCRDFGRMVGWANSHITVPFSRDDV
ncbi:hypothetical protein JX266_011643 [Neoarthrinium moseri]|nr:hypothetical protein JX266_011643 [Neoarthrinium moseri]